MAEIFISYQREDSPASAGHLYDRLAAEFGRDDAGGDLVFIDHQTLQHARVWEDTLRQHLASATVLLVVIGRNFNKNRLSEPNNFMSKEIDFAVQVKEMRIITVLLEGASLPPDNEPGDEKIWPLLRALRAGQSEPLRETTFNENVDQIIQYLVTKDGLPPESWARRNATIRPMTSAFRIVLRYEVTGVAEAMVSLADDWAEGTSTFEGIAAQVLRETRAYVERRVARLDRAFTVSPTAFGAVFLLDTERNQDDLFRNVAAAARELAAGYLDLVVRRFAPWDSFGRDWAVDVRIVVAAGRVAEIAGRDSAGSRITERTGKPLNAAAQILALRRPDDGSRSFFGRGDVIVLSGTPVTAPDGFELVENLPERWSVEGTALSIAREAALGAATLCLRARRPPVTTEHFRIHPSFIALLTTRTLTTDEKAEDLLRHVPPADYPNFARLAKSGDRVCIIVGAPGTGKTLCALRLVAELMYVDGLDVSVPPVADETWQRLRSSGTVEKVVFLDDAFGRTSLLHKDRLNIALDALCTENPESEGDDPPFLRRPTGRRPALIITVRQDIWEKACETVPGWREGLGRFTCAIETDSYAPAARRVLFESHWSAAGGAHDTNFETLLCQVETITHPLSIRDFARECAHLPSVQALKCIAPYREKALKRYTTDIATAEDPLVPLWHFLAHFFGGAMLDQEDVQRLFTQLAAKFGADRSKANRAWGRKELIHWGTWGADGRFAAAHPLREEAVDKFFASAAQEERLDGYFGAFLEVQGTIGEYYDAPALAAYAAPMVPGRAGLHRAQVIRLAASRPSSAAARLLASSIGRAFRVAPNEGDAAAATGVDDGSWASCRILLVEALGRLLSSADNAAFGTAFAALCDSIPTADSIPADLWPAAERALAELHKAAPVRASHAVKPRLGAAHRSRARIQNVDHAAWAIASNFPRLPETFREQLERMVTHGSDDWLRLRAVEAVADYIGTIRSADAARFETAIDAAMADGQPDILRRGIAGAVEANIDEISLDGETGYTWLTQCLSSVGERHNFGFMEWVIWATGQHLDDRRKESGGKPWADEDEVLAGIEILARHEDARVRKWLATALAESSATQDNDTLRAVITRLAYDEDDGVRGVAVDFFFKEDD